MTEVVNKKSSSFDVYIGRGSKWGNPFTMNSESTRDVVIGNCQENPVRLWRG